jgi:thaumarchaeosortase
MGSVDLKKYWFHIALMISIAVPIVLLIFLDYYHLQGFNYRFNPSTNSFVPWKNTFLIQNFSFDVTWKGRMFYLFFAWFLIIESAIGWQDIVKKKPVNRKLIIASIICAIIPTVYVLATNFFGLDLALLKMGHNIGIPSVTASGQPSDFLNLQWPLSVEYIVFFVFFLSAVLLAYKAKGLRIFSISFSLLGAISVAYMLDTIYQFGLLRPLQEIALPITATSAALFDFLGYGVQLNYPVQVGGSSVPSLTVSAAGRVATVSVSWACAGVYSLILYLLIILVLFKRTNISGTRKSIYFIIGLFGTFCSAVFRICFIVLVIMHSGYAAGMFFHNTYGELFGFTWVFVFIMIIVCIERFMLVERTREGFRKISSRFGGAKNSQAQPSLPN